MLCYCSVAFIPPCNNVSCVLNFAPRPLRYHPRGVGAAVGARARPEPVGNRIGGGAMEAWKEAHAEQLRALGLPSSLLEALYEQTQAEQNQADPFEHRGAGVFVRQSKTNHTGVDPDLRVSPLAGVLPLRHAAAAAAAASLRLSAAQALRLSTPHAAAVNESVRDVWLRGVPVHAASSGCGQESLALLDPLAEKVRHAAHATHRLGIFHPGKPRRPVSVMWRIAPGEGAAEGAAEVTRDYLHGRYLLDTPSTRALQSLPWLPRPELWHREEERHNPKSKPNPSPSPNPNPSPSPSPNQEGQRLRVFGYSRTQAEA